MSLFSAYDEGSVAAMNGLIAFGLYLPLSSFILSRNGTFSLSSIGSSKGRSSASSADPVDREGGGIPTVGLQVAPLTGGLHDLERLRPGRLAGEHQFIPADPEQARERGQVTVDLFPLHVTSPTQPACGGDPAATR